MLSSISVDALNDFHCFHITGHAVVLWLRRYIRIWKVAGSIPDEIIEFFFNLLDPSTALGPGVYSTSNRNKCQNQKKMSLGSKVRPMLEADNLAAICE
jgi:hypothetical protein